MDAVDLCVLAALRQELEPLSCDLVSIGERSGLALFEGLVAGRRVRAAVGGVGKVAAAHAAAVLVEARPRFGLVVVGVCGGLATDQHVGELVHCTGALQCDLFLPWRADHRPDPVLAALWRTVAPGAEARFLTADRAAIMPWRRWMRRRRFGPEPGVADMETAAAAWVAERAGVPWAALRAISDTQGWRASRSFAHNFQTQAPRAAATLPLLLAALSDAPPDRVRP